MAYALVVERLERHVLNERVVVAMAGDGETPLPNLTDELNRLDEELSKPPAPITPEDRDREALLRALGVRT